MGRRKKNTEADAIETEEITETTEATETELEADSADSNEQAETEEISEEETAEVEAEAEATEEKPKQKRRSRKKVAAVEADIEETAASDEEATEVEPTLGDLVAAASGEEETQVEAVEEKPKQKRRSRKKAEPVAAEVVATESSSQPHLREDVSIAEVSIHKSMDSMVKQWSAVKDISGSVCLNLEQVAKVLSQVQANHQHAQDDVAKKNYHKSVFHTKVAAAASSLAIILSLISLGLAQSARQDHVVAELAKTPAVATTNAAPTEKKELAAAKSPNTVMDVLFPKKENTSHSASPKKNDGLWVSKHAKKPKK